MSMACTSIQINDNLLSRRKKRRSKFSINDWPFHDLETDFKPTSMARITDSKNRILRVVIGCENGDVFVRCWPKGRILARWSSGVNPVTAIHICNHSDNQISSRVSAFLGTESGQILSVEGSLIQPDFIRYIADIKACCQRLIFNEGHLSATSGWRTIPIPLESSDSRRKIQTIFAV